MSFLSGFGIKTEVVGLDIGPSILRMAQLKYPRQHAPLVATSEVVMPKRLFDKNIITDADGLSNALRTLIDTGAPHNFSAKAVVAALPETYIFTRIVQVPHLTPGDLEKALVYEIGQYLPVPIEEVYYDYTPLALRKEKQVIDIAIFAAPRSLVDPLIEIIRSNGLELYALETKATAVVRSLMPSGAHNAALIVEIGNEATRLTIVDHGDVWLTTSLTCGEEQILKSIATSTNRTPKDVSQFIGHGETKEIKSALKSALAPIIQEVASVTRYHSTRDYNPTVLNRTIVVGQAAGISGLIESMNESLQKVCEIGTPLIGNVSKLDLKYTVAIGLAMRPL